MLALFFLQGIGRRATAFKRDQRDDGRAFQLVWLSDDGCLSHRFMRHQSAFDLGRAETMTGDVDDVVDPAHDPEIAVLISARAIAGKIDSGNLRPVLLLVTRIVSVDRAEHRRPWFLNDQVSSLVWANGFAVASHDVGVDAREWFGPRAGLRRLRA